MGVFACFFCGPVRGLVQIKIDVVITNRDKDEKSKTDANSSLPTKNFARRRQILDLQVQAHVPLYQAVF